MVGRSGMKPIYVGDIGEVFLQPVQKTLPDVDYYSLDIHELFAIAIEANIDIKLFIGIDNCYEHEALGMVAIGNRELPQGFNWIEHVKYCRNCYLMFRLRKLPK